MREWYSDALSEAFRKNDWLPSGTSLGDRVDMIRFLTYAWKQVATVNAGRRENLLASVLLRKMTVMRDKQVEWGSFRDRLLPRP
jgi:hypothetical protein